MRSQIILQARNTPKSGYFSDADPHAEVYSPLGGVEQTDYTKRGGRYTSDFIWNTKWKDQLDLEVSQKDARKKAAESKEAPAQRGLSFSRVADLNSMDVDLSDQLRPREKQNSSQEQPAPSAQPGTSAAERVAVQRRILYERGRQNAGFENVAPTQGESRRWERSGRFTKKVVSTASTAPEEVEAAAARLEAERAEYAAMKQGLFRWSLGTTAVCFAAAYTFYSRDTAASYGLGAVGGLFYLRLLNRSVDGMGASFLGAAGGQARLLIPVILALAYNRWHLLGGVEKTGIDLELLPMLLGFFTYKAGVVSKQFVDLVGAVARGTQEGPPVKGDDNEDMLTE
ncbi:probable ATP synthase protein I at C-terminar half [Coccomyxa sp. Obi]|nr:probable ATP synthase protein I at C-terminar half [Coccomyxa sp. Obi]